MTRRATFVAAALVAVGRPTWWFLALATFLLRGGVFLIVLPIVSLPSVLGLSNVLAPIIVPLALGRIEPVVVLGPTLIIGVLLGWLILGGRLAAGIDVALVGEAAGAALDEGVAGPEAGAPETPRSGSDVGWRVVAIRLVAWLPLAVTLGTGVARVAGVAYAELTRPVDVVTPLVVRVARESVSELSLIVVAWAIGELVGGVATRRVTLTPAGHWRALGWGVRASAAMPLSWLVPWVATTALLFVVIGLILGASAFAWTRAVDSLSNGVIDPLLSMLTLLAFVAVWFAALLLGGAILAVRSASQTFEHVRRRSLERPRRSPPQAHSDADAAGTFGASTGGRPGDWSADDGGGSL